MFFLKLYLSNRGLYNRSIRSKAVTLWNRNSVKMILLLYKQCALDFAFCRHTHTHTLLSSQPTYVFKICWHNNQYNFLIHSFIYTFYSRMLHKDIQRGYDTAKSSFSNQRHKFIGHLQRTVYTRGQTMPIICIGYKRWWKRYMPTIRRTCIWKCWTSTTKYHLWSEFQFVPTKRELWC